MPVIYYEGDEVYFRPLELSDEPKLRQWINDPRVWTTLNHRPPINEVRERKWIEREPEPGEYVFGISVKEDDRLIGTLGLHQVHPIAHRCLLGIMVGDLESQNKGYGTAAMRLALRFAFRELNLNRVYLEVYANNPRAIRVYEKVGFVREGCFRERSFREGRFEDVYAYAILRREWQAQYGEVDAKAAQDATAVA